MILLLFCSIIMHLVTYRFFPAHCWLSGWCFSEISFSLTLQVLQQLQMCLQPLALGNNLSICTMHIEYLPPTNSTRHTRSPLFVFNLSKICQLFSCKKNIGFSIMQTKQEASLKCKKKRALIMNLLHYIADQLASASSHPYALYMFLCLQIRPTTFRGLTSILRAS
jgi:hypothetical protein